MQIKAKVILDSIHDRSRVTTVVCEVPKFLIAEINTHRALVKNSASSRAIPTNRLIKQITDDPVIPIFWGKNKPGMEASESIEDTQAAIDIWLEARCKALEFAKRLNDLGVHKQTVNRLLEPWMASKVILTGQFWANFFALRVSEHAQPEFDLLAGLILREIKNSTPVKREEHIPFTLGDEVVQDKRVANVAKLLDFIPKGKRMGIATRLMISTARCARVSYLNHDGKIEIDKDLDLAQRLLEHGHMSPFEHQCLLKYDDISDYWGKFRFELPNHTHYSVNQKQLLSEWEERQKQRGVQIGD